MWFPSMPGYVPGLHRTSFEEESGLHKLKLKLNTVRYARELSELVIKIWKPLDLAVTVSELLEIKKGGIYRHRREIGQGFISGTC